MNDANALDALAAEASTAIANAHAALEAAEAARRTMNAKSADLLTGLGELIESTYPLLSGDVDTNGRTIDVDTIAGLYDDEHGYTRAIIRLSVRPNGTFFYELTSLAARNGEQFGASITTSDTAKLLATLATYVPTADA